MQLNRSRFANLAVLLTSVVFGLSLVEGIARLLPEELFADNTALAGDLLLGAPLHNLDVKADFPEDSKPSDVYRIAVLGDSHTVSVPKDASYAKVLQRLLNDGVGLGKRIEVYNAGAPGHSHYQYYLTLRERLIQYKPDLVIVGFYIGNDFLDLYRNDDRPSLHFDGQQFNHRSPEFLKYTDPAQSQWLPSFKVVHLLREVFRRTVGYQLSRVKALWVVGEQSGEGYGASAQYLFKITRGYFINQHIFRQSMNQILFLQSFPREQIVIDRVNRKVTELMKQLAERERISLLYAPIPTKLQVEPDSDPAVLDRTLAVCGYDRSVLPLEDRLGDSFVSMLKEYGIDSVDVKGALKEQAKLGTLYEETYHLTDEAHAVVGKVLSQRVRQIIGSRGSPSELRTGVR